MKVMIVSDGVDGLFAKALVYVVGSLGYKAFASSNEDALENLFCEEPTHILVGEYCEVITKEPENFNRGKETFDDLKNSANENVKIFRLGLDEYNYPNYIQLPFQTEELKKLFKK